MQVCCWHKPVLPGKSGKPESARGLKKSVSDNSHKHTCSAGACSAVGSQLDFVGSAVAESVFHT